MPQLRDMLVSGLMYLGFSEARAGSMLRVLRFLITGSIATLINIGALYIFTEYLGFWYIYSAILAFIVSFSYNFAFQKYWVFKNREHHKIPQQLPLHLGTALLGLLERTVLLYLFVEYAHVWYVLAQAIATIIVAFQSFFFFKKIYR